MGHSRIINYVMPFKSNHHILMWLVGTTTLLMARLIFSLTDERNGSICSFSNHYNPIFICRDSIYFFIFFYFIYDMYVFLLSHRHCKLSFRVWISRTDNASVSSNYNRCCLRKLTSRRFWRNDAVLWQSGDEKTTCMFVLRIFQKRKFSECPKLLDRFWNGVYWIVCCIDASWCACWCLRITMIIISRMTSAKFMLSMRYLCMIYGLHKNRRLEEFAVQNMRSHPITLFPRIWWDTKRPSRIVSAGKDFEITTSPLAVIFLCAA